MPNDLFFNNAFEQSPDPELEEKQIQEIVDLVLQLMKKRYADQNKTTLRGVHPKSHGCVDATFEVLPDLDASLRVGLFSKPATYKAQVRYSNASAVVGADLDAEGKNGSQGMALKVLVGEGNFLVDDNGRGSQDFLMINTPSFAFANVHDYLKLNQVLLQFNDDPRGFFAPLAEAAKGIVPTDPEKLAELGRIKASFAIVNQIKAIEVANPLELSFFGAAPFLFGKDRCMRVSAVPQGGAKPQIRPQGATDDYLRAALQETMNGNEALVYNFRIQVRKAGEPDLFIEDATKSWDMQQDPPHTVARITIPAPQVGLGSPERSKECEQLVYTPWHALPEHQPLGGINRLRHAVYIAGSNRRLGQGH